MNKNYNPDYVINFYNQYSNKEWERFNRTPLEEIKLYIHNYYIQKYVKKGMRVLDIGAGPGRFTQLLNKIGCKVLVADISPVQLELNKQYSNKYKFKKCIIDWKKIDICNMKELESQEFDCVIAYGGPLSYVFEKRNIAVKECKRVLKSNGLFLSSSMSLFGTVHQYLKGVLEIPAKNIKVIMSTGDLTPSTEPNNKHSCHMYRASEYKDLFLKSGLKVLEMSASNSVSTNQTELLTEIKQNKKKWNELLNIEQEACSSSGYLDGGSHIILIAQKK